MAPPSTSDPSVPRYATLLSDAEGPPGPHTGPACPFYSDDSDGDDGEPVRGVRPTGWWARLRGGEDYVQRQQQSGYLTLIPLSDSRLKPQHTQLIVGTLLFLTLVSVCLVYLAVARGVTAGSIEVVDSTISFNNTAGTYQLVLWSQLPIYNPNYASVRVSGRINVSFYDQQAGFTILEPVDIPARSQPKIITVDINSSSVPHKYLFTIYTQCFTFPEKLIFFLTADLKSQYLGTTYALPRIDNYAIVNCTGAQTENRKRESTAQSMALASTASASGSLVSVGLRLGLTSSSTLETEEGVARSIGREDKVQDGGTPQPRSSKVS